MVTLIVSVVALSVAGWAALLALGVLDRLRRLELSLTLVIDRATAEENEHTAALQLRTKELEQARARLEALKHKYETTLKLFQESVEIDGGGPRRIQ